MWTICFPYIHGHAVIASSHNYYLPEHFPFHSFIGFPVYSPKETWVLLVIRTMIFSFFDKSYYFSFFSCIERDVRVEIRTVHKKICQLFQSTLAKRLVIMVVKSDGNSFQINHDGFAIFFNFFIKFKFILFYIFKHIY